MGGFCNWKLEFDSFADKGAVRFVGALKFKLAVGGLADESIVAFIAEGTGVVVPQAQ